VLAGFLSGARLSPSVGPLYDDFDEPIRLGHCRCAIGIERFRDLEAFTAEIGAYIDDLQSVETRDGSDEIKRPREMEAALFEEQRGNGVESRSNTVDRLEAIGETYGVALPSPVE
jgi:LDH2 family malate/lactate/ureidoglycolate dehydrogenase